MTHNRAVYNCVRYTVAPCTRLDLPGEPVTETKLNPGLSVWLPMQLGTPSLGKVAYCATFITSSSPPSSSSFNSELSLQSDNQLIAVGAEDGSVKVFAIKKQVSSCVVGVAGDDPRSQYQFGLVQEVQMPSNVAARAICYCRSANSSTSSLVIAGGGRLMFSIWRFRDRVSAGVSGVLPLGCVLEQVYASNCTTEACRRGNKPKNKKEKVSGKEKQSQSTEALEQDHRILATAALPVCSARGGCNQLGESFLIIFCDSRGIVQVLRLIDSTAASGCGEPKEQRAVVLGSGSDSVQLIEEGEFAASSYPLLSCALLSMSLQGCRAAAATTSRSGEGEVHLGIVGDTHGQIGVWLLGTSAISDR
jgi:hypothetical protein